MLFLFVLQFHAATIRLLILKSFTHHLTLVSFSTIKIQMLILSDSPLMNFTDIDVLRINMYRISPPELFLRKDVLKICSKFTGEHPCQSVISIRLFCNFVEIALRHGCSPQNLLHIFRNLFLEAPVGGCFCMQMKKFLNVLSNATFLAMFS